MGTYVQFVLNSGMQGRSTKEQQQQLSVGAPGLQLDLLRTTVHETTAAKAMEEAKAALQACKQHVEQLAAMLRVVEALDQSSTQLSESHSDTETQTGSSERGESESDVLSPETSSTPSPCSYVHHHTEPVSDPYNSLPPTGIEGPVGGSDSYESKQLHPLPDFGPGDAGEDCSRPQRFRALHSSPLSPMSQDLEHLHHRREADEAFEREAAAIVANLQVRPRRTQTKRRRRRNKEDEEVSVTFRFFFSLFFFVFSVSLFLL